MADNFFSKIVDRFFGGEIERRVNLAVKALDDVRDRLFSRSGDKYPRDRRGYDREEVLADALEAWRVNPLARRIVELTTQYVVGGGIGIESKHERTNKFLNDWWTHRLNNMPTRTGEWCDELTRSGELFIVLTTDLSGMSYMRAIPAADIQEIETADNDLEQEITIYEKPSMDDENKTLNEDGLLRGRAWQVYNEATGNDDPISPVMLHYAVNRPVGAKHGESDLAPILRWLVRYAAWLEDRARLNRYRQSFLYTVKARFASEAERLRRQSELNMNPPNPGSILVIDETEDWSVLFPNLSSFEAAEDGLALKKMIAAGSGNPLHFLAEPESATRTTAESAGGPTFRHYEQRQEYFLWMIQDIAKVAVKRRKYFDRLINVKEEIHVSGTDISARDNAALAAAASTIIGSFLDLRELNMIDDSELLRVAYRFAGEVADIEEILKRGKEAPKIEVPRWRPRKGGAGRPGGIDIDPISGEPENIDRASPRL